MLVPDIIGVVRTSVRSGKFAFGVFKRLHIYIFRLFGYAHIPHTQTVREFAHTT